MNILLIDNEESLLDLMEGLIRFSVDISDLNIEKAQKADEAKHLALQNGPECVVIDPHFSDEWGLPLIKTIKEFKPKTFLIAFSNCSDAPCRGHCREQCLEAGANWHFDKTKDFMRVPQVIRELSRFVFVEEGQNPIRLRFKDVSGREML
ncbi:response regulator [Nitrospina watsonii]|uniref:Response regulatory domain-containing protein n=1 Tax=Nitrospina watsonii TaxID=1323948 RepID=A0ABM9HAG5_9BACT|nr:response regulator [Nitrospina watsonii]CAI2717123.1 protein of unknown function [Nitrospina watsonii]